MIEMHLVHEIETLKRVCADLEELVEALRILLRDSAELADEGLE